MTTSIQVSENASTITVYKRNLSTYQPMIFPGLDSRLKVSRSRPRLVKVKDQDRD